MIEVAAYAQAYGWRPHQVKRLYRNLGIPTKAARRTQEDWHRLKIALEQGPQAKAFTTWDVALPNGTKGKVLIPGLFHCLVQREDGSKEWIGFS